MRKGFNHKERRERKSGEDGKLTDRGCGGAQPQTPTKTEKAFVIVNKEPKQICAISLSSIENGGEGRGEEEPLYLLETTELPNLVPWQRVLCLGCTAFNFERCFIFNVLRLGFATAVLAVYMSCFDAVTFRVETGLVGRKSPPSKMRPRRISAPQNMY